MKILNLTTEEMDGYIKIHCNFIREDLTEVNFITSSNRVLDGFWINEILRTAEEIQDEEELVLEDYEININ